MWSDVVMENLIALQNRCVTLFFIPLIVFSLSRISPVNLSILLLFILPESLIASMCSVLVSFFIVQNSFL